MTMYNVFVGMSAMLRDRKGIAAMEYAILAAAILGAIAAGAATLGTDVSTLLTNLGTHLTGIKFPT